MTITATTPCPENEILDDLFHGCAVTAFVEQARLVVDWPNIEHVRRRAFDLYERALSERARSHRP